jgi:isopentenyl-diphosphate Delta-isomerase
MSEVMVVLVDENDLALGAMEKIEAHKKGMLHRAFSVFVFNENEEMLLHQRAMEKYHSPGLWTNTCCSHPMPEQDTLIAAVNRLEEEMGMTCELEKAFHFIYRAELDNEMIEHELDHVFVGYTNSNPMPNASEVMNWKWMKMDDIILDVNENPHLFTEWFKIALPHLLMTMDSNDVNTNFVK